MSYDGTNYYGWQKTPKHPTIQGEINKACFYILQEEVESEAASRTDRGVHARGQVVQIVSSKEMSENKLRLGLNAKLPADIRVLAVERVDPEFHATLHSHGKTYWYYIDTGPGQNPFTRRFAWHYPRSLDLEKMRCAAREMVGERDFGSFTTVKTKEGMRTVESIEVVQLEPHFLRIEMTGNRFLYKMARTVAGTLADIGSGKVDLGILDKLFRGAGRAMAGVTAPAHGLTLQKIHY